MASAPSRALPSCLSSPAERRRVARASSLCREMEMRCDTTEETDLPPTTSWLSPLASIAFAAVVRRCCVASSQPPLAIENQGLKRDPNGPALFLRVAVGSFFVRVFVQLF